MSLNNTLPNIEIILNNENRAFSCSFYDTVANAFEALPSFIISSYSLNSTEQFFIQYEDDDNDFVTIGSFEDFEEAIEESNLKNKLLKIFVILKKNDIVHQDANVCELKKKEQLNLDYQQEETNNEQKRNENEFTNHILNDLQNNKIFREEVISFIKTALILFQHNSNPDYDIVTCIITASSSHPMLMQHEALQNYIMNLLPFIAARIQPFSSFLTNIDLKMVGIWINQMIDGWTNKLQYPISFLLLCNIINSILYVPSADQPIVNNKEISSSKTDKFFDFTYYRSNYQNNNSHPIMPSSNTGSQLSILIPPNQNDIKNVDPNINANMNDISSQTTSTRHYNSHPLFVGHQWLNGRWPYQNHKFINNNDSDVITNVPLK